MKKVLLDTSFILSCVGEKVDFFDRLEDLGYGVVISANVIKEIKRLADFGKTLKLRGIAILALKILESEKYESLDIKGKYVDSAIVNYLKTDSEYALATVDKELKKKVTNPKIVLRARKRLEVL